MCQGRTSTPWGLHCQKGRRREKGWEEREIEGRRGDVEGEEMRGEEGR